MVVMVMPLVMMSTMSLTPMLTPVPAVLSLLEAPAYSPSQLEGRLPRDHAKQQQHLGERSSRLRLAQLSWIY